MTTTGFFTSVSFKALQWVVSTYRCPGPYARDEGGGGAFSFNGMLKCYCWNPFQFQYHFTVTIKTLTETKQKTDSKFTGNTPLLFGEIAACEIAIQLQNWDIEKGSFTIRLVDPVVCDIYSIDFHICLWYNHIRETSIDYLPVQTSLVIFHRWSMK